MKVPISYLLVMTTVEIFGEVVSNIFLTRMPLHVKYPCLTWSVVQKNRISMDRERCFLTVSFAMPTAVRLSQNIGVGGCACPNSSRIVRSILRSFALRKRAPSSASAAEVTTNFRIPLWTYIAPLIGMGSPFWGMEPRK